MSTLEKLVLLVVVLGVFAAGGYGAYRAYEAVASKPNQTVPQATQVEAMGAAIGVAFGTLFLVGVITSIFGVRGDGMTVSPRAYYGYPLYATSSLMETLFWMSFFERM
jgi:hypothetical protein